MTLAVVSGWCATAMLAALLLIVAGFVVAELRGQ